jgi:hypothetical protein
VVGRGRVKNHDDVLDPVNQAEVQSCESEWGGGGTSDREGDRWRGEVELSRQTDRTEPDCRPYPTPCKACMSHSALHSLPFNFIALFQLRHYYNYTSNQYDHDRNPFRLRLAMTDSVVNFISKTDPSSSKSVKHHPSE